MINSKRMAHLDGRKKLLKYSEVVDVTPKFVYYPIDNDFGNTLVTKLKVGDKVTKGELIGKREKFDIPVYMSVNGKVVKSEDVVIASGAMTPTIKIQLDKDQEEMKRMKHLDWKATSREKLIARIKEAGIIGLGGAGFPTHIKYEASNLEMLIINAVECEPYLVSDYHVLDEHWEIFLHGVQIAMKASAVEKAVIAVKAKNKELIKSLNEMINIEGLTNIKIKKIADKYPMGWEKSLVRKIKGKNYNRLPSEVGCVVSNSTTIVQIAKAVIDGEPITHRIITVAGDALESAGVFNVPVGTLGTDILKLTKVIDENHSIKKGGPMMGSSMKSDNFPITAITNGIIVSKLLDPKKEMTCLRCGKCTLHCPVGISPEMINRAKRANMFDEFAKLYADTCLECGLCSAICPSNIPLTSTVKLAKTITLAKQKAAAAQAAAEKK